MAALADLIDSLNEYHINGRPTGDCLRALLANDLMDFIRRADPETLTYILPLAQYVHNRLDLRCWGSHEKVDAWLRKKNAERQALAKQVDEV